MVMASVTFKSATEGILDWLIEKTDVSVLFLSKLKAAGVLENHHVEEIGVTLCDLLNSCCFYYGLQLVKGCVTWKI
jgi:hypothetical protein